MSICRIEARSIRKSISRISLLLSCTELATSASEAQATTYRSIINLRFSSESEIPLPPLAEQRRIAEVLDRAEALRAKRRAALAQLDSLTQSIFLDLFGDPATNPKGWPEEAESASLLEAITASASRRASELLRRCPYRIRFDRRRSRHCDGTSRYLNDVLRSGYVANRSLRRGLLCITIGVNIAKEPECSHATPDFLTALSLSRQTHREFAVRPIVHVTYPFSRSRIKIVAPNRRRNEHAKLDSLRMTVPLPPIELQREFARRVRAVEKLKTAQRASLAELDALFASLQHRAFRGEL